MKGFIIYPTYEIIEGKPKVFLYGRLENGESFLTINEYKPYFYIKEESLEEAKKILEELDFEKTKLKNFNGDSVVKIYVKTPADVPKVKHLLLDQGIENYESDIKFAYRFMFDKNIKGSLEIEGDFEAGEKIDRIYREPDIFPTEYIPKNLKVLSLDIESDKDTGEIWCLSIIHKTHSKTFLIGKEKINGIISCKDEEELLGKFVQEVNEIDPDIMTGWNVIDFDFAKLYERCKKNKVEFNIARNNSKIKLRIEESFFRTSKIDIEGRQVLDALNLMRVSFIKVDDYKLETVASKVLGEGKLIKFKGDKYQELKDLYENNKKKLCEYNLKDAELVLKIIEKTGILDLSIQRSLITGMPLDRVNASIASLDSLYIREARKRGLVLPSGGFAEKETEIKGGYVRESEPGIYDYMIILDFKSMYSSIIRTFNIDPYSFVKDRKGKNLVVAPNGACFRNEEGILPSILTELYKEREKTRKNKNELARYAIKTLSNSFFGVLGNPSCRFFDMELVNSITYFAQEISKLTHEEIVKLGYKVIYGDSITKDRFVTLLINNKLTIKNIEELFNDYKEFVIQRADKEIINLSNLNIKSLTINKETLKPEFSKLNEIIRHKTDKEIYRINQKYGETICTEDHSIMTLSNNKLMPVKVKEIKDRQLINVKYKTPLNQIKMIDLYEILKDYKTEIIYKGRKKISEVKIEGDYIYFSWMKMKKMIMLKRFIKINSKEFESLCRLLAVYIAEGSSSTPETTKSRLGASISSSNIPLLKQLQKDYYNLFINSKVSIIKSTKKIRDLTYYNNKQKMNVVYEDKTYKLQLMNVLSAVFFKKLCGQKSHYKKLPEFLYHVPNDYKAYFLKFMVFGDGSKRENDIRYTGYYKAKNFSYNTSSLQLISGLSFLLGQLNINYSLQYRPSKKNYTIQTSSKNNYRLNTKITKENYKDYVYDLNIEDNHMFVDSCGQILLHNTDSTFVISKAKNLEEADKIGKKIEKHINEFYKEFIKKEYKRESYLELNYEKCFVKCIMPKLRGKEEGAKKRYAGLVIKDGKEEIQFTGLESKRSDWTELAKKYQLEVLTRIFHNKEVAEYTKKFVEDVRKGKYDELLVYRKNIRKELENYTKITPQHIQAARKLLNGIKGDKIEYLITEDGPEPIQNLKHKIDYEHYIEKQIKPIADSILVFFNTNFEDLIKGNKQGSLFDY